MSLFSWAEISVLQDGEDVKSAVASPVARAGQPFLRPNSLVISSTTYVRTRGAIAALTIGTTLPGSATATSAAVAGNNYVEVCNNASPDASFGVTSPIFLTDVEPHTGHVFGVLRVPSNGADPNKVVRITDRLRATTLTGEVARETFTTIAGPTYGTAYRGVAYVCGAIDPRAEVCHTGGF